MDRADRGTLSREGYECAYLVPVVRRRHGVLHLREMLGQGRRTPTRPGFAELDTLEKALKGKKVEEGDMISAFVFDGSDIVMVIERRSNVNVTAMPGVRYPVRSQYA